MTKKKVITKKVCQKIHARNRLHERYGVYFNRTKMREIVNMIQRNQCIHIECQTNRISIKQLTYENLTFRVVYDKNTHVVVSFLPLEEKEPNNEM